MLDVVFTLPVKQADQTILIEPHAMHWARTYGLYEAGQAAAIAAVARAAVRNMPATAHHTVRVPTQLYATTEYICLDWDCRYCLTGGGHWESGAGVTPVQSPCRLTSCRRHPQLHGGH